MSISTQASFNEGKTPKNKQTMETHVIEACTGLSQSEENDCVVVSRSPKQEVDRADGGGAEGVCDEAAGRTGGDGQRQETEGGQGHPLPGSGCVGAIHYSQQWAFITADIFVSS